MSHRIGKEYLALQKTLRDPAYRHVLELAPESDQDLSRWRARIAGPPDTPYAGHAFTLVIQIPSTYPMEPPQVRFEPRAMPHCNVDFDSGRICLNILEKAHWSPAWNVLHVVHAVWLLLSDPVPDSPLDVDLACLARAQDTAAMDGLLQPSNPEAVVDSNSHCTHLIIMAKKINWNEVGPVGGTPLLSPAFVTSRAGELVFTSGCVGSDPKTDKMPEDLEQQVRNALENLQNVLKASGSSLEHVIKVLLFVADPSYAAVVNRVYQQYLPNAPARSCVVVSFPNPAIKVELECVAQVPARRRGWFCRL